MVHRSQEVLYTSRAVWKCSNQQAHSSTNQQNYNQFKAKTNYGSLIK